MSCAHCSCHRDRQAPCCTCAALPHGFAPPASWARIDAAVARAVARRVRLQAPPPWTPLAAALDRHVLATLEHTGGNAAAAARLLDVHESTVRRRRARAIAGAGA